MKAFYLFFTIMLFWSPVFAQQDEAAIKDIINKAYVGGIHNGGPLEDILEGFHPSFQMFSLVENETNTTTRDAWVERIAKGREKNPNPPSVLAEGKFLNIFVVGNSANVSLELHKGGKRVFTDHLMLYKFDEGWRIVAKSFFRHP